MLCQAHTHGLSLYRPNIRTILRISGGVPHPGQCGFFSSWKSIALTQVQEGLRRIRQKSTWKFKSLGPQGHSVLSAEIDIAKHNHKSGDTQEHDVPNVLQLQFGGTPRPQAIPIGELLQALPPAGLNSFLQSKPPTEVNQVATRMTGFLIKCVSRPMQQQVLHILTKERIHDMDITNRVDLLRTLQQSMPRRKFSSPALRKCYHEAVSNIFLHTYGADLTELKEQVGMQTSTMALKTLSRSHFGDLDALVYAVRPIIERVEILQHIAVQAATLEPQIKVLSDIDDTLYAGGWFDSTYPPHRIYPGLLYLFQLCSRVREAAADHYHVRAITFLTARPRGVFSFGKNFTTKSLQSLGLHNPTVLPGSVQGLLSHHKIAQQKFDNFRLYHSLFPEFSYVFFGDTSQGDALFGKWLLRHYPEKVRGVFIHDLSPERVVTGDGGDKGKYVNWGVHFYQTAVGAGIGAHQRHLCSSDELEALIHKTQEMFHEVVFSDVGQREKSWTILEQEINQAKDYLNTKARSSE